MLSRLLDVTVILTSTNIEAKVYGVSPRDLVGDDGKVFLTGPFAGKMKTSNFLVTFRRLLRGEVLYEGEK